MKLKLERIVIRVCRSISFAQADDMDFFVPASQDSSVGLAPFKGKDVSAWTETVTLTL